MVKGFRCFFTKSMVIAHSLQKVADIFRVNPSLFSSAYVQWNMFRQNQLSGKTVGKTQTLQLGIVTYRMTSNH